MAKGIGNILASGGRSEETTGIECQLDMESLITGTAFKLFMPNLTTGTGVSIKATSIVSGGKFLDVAGSSGSLFSIGYDGSITLTNDITLTTGNLTISAGNISAIDAAFTGTITGTSMGSDTLLEGNILSNRQYLFDRTKRYNEWIEDFTLRSRYSGATLAWTVVQETGSSAAFNVGPDEPLGVAMPTIADDAYAAGHVEYKNKFVKFLPGKKYWFEARVKTGKFYKHGYYVGLTDESLWLMPQMTGASSAVGSGCASNYIGFTTKPRSNKWHFVFGNQIVYINSGSSTPNLTTGTTGTYQRLGFFLELGSGLTIAKPYYDDTVGAPPTETTDQAGTSYPWGVALCPVAGVSHNADAGTSLVIDYIKVVQER